MSKSLAASQKVMRSYLSELLTDDAEPVQHKEPDNEQLEQLLEKVKPSETLPVETTVTTTKAKAKVLEEPKQVEVQPVETIPLEVKRKTPIQTSVDDAELAIQTNKSSGTLKLESEKNYREGSFQAMFFEVGGLTIAVPLIELGGIHNADKTNSLMGKPDWFKGVMVHREENINVVDTALWVMPEKCDEKLKDSLNYQYIIMLSNSQWGLSAETLVDTVTLEQDDVKWIDGASKRPWLAGLVKNRMCALLNVDAMINLLDEGLGVHAN